MTIRYLDSPRLGRVEIRLSPYRSTLSAEVKADGKLVVHAPSEIRLQQISSFLERRQDWILSHMERQKKMKQAAVSRGEGFYAPGELTLPRDRLIRRLREETREMVRERLPYYSAMIGVSYGKVTIRAMTTRWGTCSGKGDLSFNVLLARCPEEVLDYVVVHELCHRREMNHSPRFWALVEKVLPDYRSCRQWLKTYGTGLIAVLEEKSREEGGK